MKAYVLLIPFFFACSGTDREQQTTELATLNLKEVSGMEYIEGSDLIWMLEDSGNKSMLFGVDRKGEVKSHLTLNVSNNDWESLASDAEGNLYVGDFGNNDNDRTNLAIHKVPKDALAGKRAAVSATVTFKYPEQKDFPPQKSEKFYDCEAFLEHEGNFYLFTKNRSSKSDGSFVVYRVPNTDGNHEAERIGTLKTCSNKSCQVTGADISPDGKTVALITADKLYLLTGYTKDNFSNANADVLDMGHLSQKEGVCFTDNHTVLVTDEKTKKGGGKLYEVKLPKLKGKV